MRLYTTRVRRKITERLDVDHGTRVDHSYPIDDTTSDISYHTISAIYRISGV